jgi:hypothetical protein
MKNKIIEKIEKKIGLQDISDRITSKLTKSEINSLYLDLFNRQSSRVNLTELLKH